MKAFSSNTSTGISHPDLAQANPIGTSVTVGVSVCPLFLSKDSCWLSNFVALERTPLGPTIAQGIQKICDTNAAILFRFDLQY